uniref:Uncharacterized protein n=1 Tax=Anopheles maculatus TaxID=74869 RepID=A0A182TBA0_9DIPT
MPINTQELLSAVAVLTDKQSMRVTLKSSAKGAAVAGSSTFLGGLVAGPIGLFLGGAVGGLVAYAMTNNQFKPVSHVIMHDLSVREQEQLKQRIVDALSRFQPTDLVVIASLLAGNMAAQQTVITAVVSFLTNEMLADDAGTVHLGLLSLHRALIDRWSALVMGTPDESTPNPNVENRLRIR